MQTYTMDTAEQYRDAAEKTGGLAEARGANSTPSPAAPDAGAARSPAARDAGAVAAVDPRPSVFPSAIALLAAVGLALFCSATWTARADASGVATAVVYTTRFVSFGTYMLIAWLFRNHLPSVDHLLAIALPFMGVHLAIVLAGPALALEGTAGLVVDYVSGVFEGVANALVMLLYAHILSSFAPRRSAVAVAIAYLLVDALILVLDLLDVTTLHYMRSAFIVASMLVLAWCVHRLLGVGPGGIGDGRALQYGMARVGGEDARPLAFLTRNTDWLLLLIVAILFPNLFGVIAQVSSETGGNFALYDVTTEIVMVAAQAIFLIFMVAYGASFGFAAILAFIVPLYATGFALFPGNWAAGNPLAGCFIRGGYVVLTVLIWALMARKSYEDPRHTYLYFAVYCGISNAQLGRLVGSALMAETGPNLPLCQNISLGALWAICIFGLVMFFLMRRETGAGADRQAFRTLEASAPIVAADGHGHAGIAPMVEAVGGTGPRVAEQGDAIEPGVATSSAGWATTIGSDETAGAPTARAATETGTTNPATASPTDGRGFWTEPVARPRGAGETGGNPSHDTASPAPIIMPAPVVDRFSGQLDALAERVGLAPREREVIVEAVHGYSRSNIAKKLYLSPETVKTYLNRAYAKAGVSSKQEFIALVEREGL